MLRADKLKKKLERCLRRRYGFSKEKALQFSSTLAFSDNKDILDATVDMLKGDCFINVCFAGACCSFLLEHMYELSYPEALAFGEEFLRGMEFAAMRGEAIVIKKQNGERIELTARVYDSDGRDVTEERVSHHLDGAERIISRSSVGYLSDNK